MDMLKKLPRELQVVLGGSVLYLIFSFLDWQQVSFAGLHAGRTEWNGVGVVAGLLVFALLLWEAARLFGAKIEFGSVTPGLVSIALALLLLLFTVITFLSHNEARHWPAWVGLILSIAIAVAAFGRARAEGVQMPDLSAMTSGTGGRASSGSGSGAGAPTSPTSGSDSESRPSSSSEPPPSGSGGSGLGPEA